MRLSTIDPKDGARETPRRLATVSVKPGRSAPTARANQQPLAPPDSAAARTAADDALISVWEERGRADGPIAFRTIVRAFKEGAEGQGDAPDQKGAAVLWAWTVGGNTDALGSALCYLAEAANHDHWVTASATSPSGTFISNYVAAFVEAYRAATVDFRAAATVGDYLGVSTPEEDRWRAALSALWATANAANATPNTSRHGTEMPRLVVFHYCVSLGIVSFKRSSGVKVIPPGGSRFLAGLPYTLISICAGWWGIPWGPLWTVEAIGRNLSGGTDVTELVSSGAR